MYTDVVVTEPKDDEIIRHHIRSNSYLQINRKRITSTLKYIDNFMDV